MQAIVFKTHPNTTFDKNFAGFWILVFGFHYDVSLIATSLRSNKAVCAV